MTIRLIGGKHGAVEGLITDRKGQDEINKEPSNCG